MDIFNLVLGMYAGEPCRICGKNIEPSELSNLVFAGYSVDSKSRAAHKACWDKGLPKAEWAFPQDEPPHEAGL